MKQETQVHNQNWNVSIVKEELKNLQNLCQALMETPHYRKMGEPGIFAIVQKAKSLNLNPIDALNGGLYFVNGKVELSSNMMIQLIRQAGHSVTKDKRSDDTICILHGKRKDNGDTWTENFSIADAKRAGIYKNTWEKYPRNMLFARALSNLARQLFPDAIKGCYVEGEITSDFASSNQVEEPQQDLTELTQEQIETLEEKLNLYPEFQDKFKEFMNRHNLKNYSNIPLELYEKVMDRLDHLEEENFETQEAMEAQNG